MISEAGPDPQCLVDRHPPRTLEILVDYREQRKGKNYFFIFIFIFLFLFIYLFLKGKKESKGFGYDICNF